MISIDINEANFKRLEALTIGFDTPDSVISRLLDQAESRPEKKPKIIFNPSTEEQFKRELLQSRLAEVCLHTNESKNKQYFSWGANKLKTESNLKANIWSGFLRGWKDKGINKIELTVLKNVDQKLLDLAHALGLSYQDALIVKPNYHQEDSDTLLVSFEVENMKILEKIPHKRTSDGELFLPSYMLN